MNSYELSRSWFNFCFDNPELIKPSHTAVYFFAIEHCNRLGWKEKFGFPSQMVMEAIGIKNWRTYSKALNELVEFGFIKMIETSKNQYSSNIIAIVKNTKAHTKALDKALQKHDTKQSQSTVSIDKPNNNKQLTIKERKEKFITEIRNFLDKYGKEMCTDFYNYWTEHNPNAKKMRFELAKNQPFQISRRLATWKSRSTPVKKLDNKTVPSKEDYKFLANQQK